MGGMCIRAPTSENSQSEARDPLGQRRLRMPVQLLVNARADPSSTGTLAHEELKRRASIPLTPSRRPRPPPNATPSAINLNPPTQLQKATPTNMPKTTTASTTLVSSVAPHENQPTVPAKPHEATVPKVENNAEAKVTQNEEKKSEQKKIAGNDAGNDANQKNDGIFRGSSSVNFGGGVDPKSNGELWLWSLLSPYVSTMVDVGIYKELTFPDNGRTVQHCFEANPSFCQGLEKYLSPTVIINNVGLGSTKGQMRYYSHGETMHFRTMLGCSANCGCSKIVNVITLDEYCEQKGITQIDLIKIDVEGHELEVLKGAKNILHSTDFVQFEYGGTFADSRVKLKDVYEFLGKYGFTHFYLICPTYLALCPTPIENYAYSNYLAARGQPDILIADPE